MVRFTLLVFAASLAAQAETYCFGFLNAHPDRKELPQAQANEIQEGHMAHMRRMAHAGHLLAAGPIMTPGGPRGILIYRCATTDEARAWTALDPAVVNRRLVLDVYRWAGPDKIGELVAEKLKQDPDPKLDMQRMPLIVVRKTDRWSGDLPKALFDEHVAHAGALAKQGLLRASGPFLGADGTPAGAPGIAGVLVFKTMPLAEALAIANRDPLVREGYARLDAYEWFVAGEALPKP